MWEIENPLSSRLKDQGFMQALDYFDLDYSTLDEHGKSRPTRVWGPKGIGKLQSMFPRIPDPKQLPKNTLNLRTPLCWFQCSFPSLPLVFNVGAANNMDIVLTNAFLPSPARFVSL